LKAPVLLVSGWAHPAAALEPLAHRLAERPVRLLGLEAIHVAAPRSGLSGYASGLLQEIEAQEEPVILAGWSMGGMVALEAAAAAPGRIAALILISAAPRLAADQDFPEGVPPRILQAMTLSFRRTPERTLRDFFINAASPSEPDGETAAQFAHRALESGTEALAEQLEYLVRTDLRPACARLRMPRLLLHGTRDRIIPAGAAAWLRAHSAGTEGEVREGAGHRLPLDHPDWTAERIVRFLEGAA